MRTTSDENKNFVGFIVNNYPKKKNDHVKKKKRLIVIVEKMS
jgi:hypothetical protein